MENNKITFIIRRRRRLQYFIIVTLQSQLFLIVYIFCSFLNVVIISKLYRYKSHLGRIVGIIEKILNRNRKYINRLYCNK